jgi:predicted phosphoribosyltransferase
MIRRFRDRVHAGRRLAKALLHLAGRRNGIVLALPRGGVPVGFEVARALGAPLDVFLVRKLGVPGHEELAMGAIASGGVRVINQAIVCGSLISQDEIDRIVAAEQRELERREEAYRGGRPAPDLGDRTVILVDDGLATGASMRAAVAAVRAHRPARIIAAVPVAPPDACAALEEEADEAVCLTTPEPFCAVGAWYDDFRQTTDAEVCELLEQAAKATAAGRHQS